MSDLVREIGIVLARRRVDHPWAESVWSPHAILDPAPETAPGALLADDGRTALIYAGAASVELFAPETANYRDNLADGAPRLWVAAHLDGERVARLRVTADPTEGEALFLAGAEVVGTLPMPSDMASWIAAFVDAFHVERAFLKRQRDRSERDPGRRGRAGEP